jgi:hypothetical protein
MSPRCAQTQEIEVTGAEKQTTLLAGSCTKGDTKEY